MRYSAAILAGGRSSRFGQDKAVFVYQGRSLLSWVADSLAAADERFIVANQPYQELAVYPDILQIQTPLSGIHAALSYAKNDWVAIAACDMPHLTTQFWLRLWEWRRDADIVLPEHDEGLEPLAGFYHRSVLPCIEELVSQNNLSVQSLLSKVSVERLSLGQLNVSKSNFRNINFRSDILHSADATCHNCKL